MGNTHLEPATKENLLAYNKENGHRSVSRGIDALLAEHELLIATKKENLALWKLAEKAMDKITE